MMKLNVSFLNSSHDLGPSIGGIDLVQLLEHTQHVGIDFRLRIYPGAERVKLSFTEFANEILRENAAGRCSPSRGRESSMRGV